MPSPAEAIDKYADAQSFLTYTVYKPSRTLGLGVRTFEFITCNDQGEPWLYARYGGTVRYFEIMQTMTGVKCSDPGLSKKLPNVKVNDVTAKLYVYCDPAKPVSFAKCSRVHIVRLGGYLIFTNKARKGLKRTEIQVQVFGGITYSQLLTIAQSLKKVTP